MNSQDARDTLLLYRLEEAGDRDEEMNTALAQLEKDPELERWFAQQQEFHSAVRRNLRQIAPPAGLRERLLANRSPSKVVPWWQRSHILAIAAVIVFLLGGISFWIVPPKPHDLALYRARMAKIALRDYRMDLVTNNLDQIRAFARSKGSPSDFVLSAALQQLPEVGCASLKWQNHPVSLVCFRLGKQDLMWLFVIKQESLRNPSSTEQQEFTQIRKLTTATWRRQGNIYLLAAIGDQELIKKYL